MKATLRIGDSGKPMECDIEISGARGHMGIAISTPAERGASTRLSFDWPEAMAFAGEICQKAAEMAKVFGPKTSEE